MPSCLSKPSVTMPHILAHTGKYKNNGFSFLGWVWSGTFLKLVCDITWFVWQHMYMRMLQIPKSASILCYTSSTHTAITHHVDNPFGTSYRLWTASGLQTMPQTMDGLRVVDHAPRIQWGWNGCSSSCCSNCSATYCSCCNACCCPHQQQLHCGEEKGLE